MSAPLVLAIDTSGADAGLALAGEGFLAGESFLDVAHLSSRAGGHARTEDLSLETATLLAARGLGARDLTVIGAVVGPGSYTGLRSALAFVRGLAFADSLPAVAVGTLELLVWRAARAGESVVAACPLSEGRHLMAVYRREENDVRELLEPFVVDDAEAAVFLGGDARGEACLVMATTGNAAGRAGNSAGSDAGSHPRSDAGSHAVNHAGNSGENSAVKDSALVAAARRASLEVRAPKGDSLAALARLVLARSSRGESQPVEDLLPFYVGQSNARPNRHRVALSGGPE